MAGIVGREQIVEAIHAGLAEAIADYDTWTGARTTRQNIIESVAAVYAARAIATTMRSRNSLNFLTVEQTFGELFSYAEKASKIGRPPDELKDMRQKLTSRADIVLWNRDWAPRAVIKVKTELHPTKLIPDVKRLINWLKFFGRPHGTIRYGVLATVYRYSETRNTAKKRLEACRDSSLALTKTAGLKCVTRPEDISEGPTTGSVTYLISS